MSEKFDSSVTQMFRAEFDIELGKMPFSCYKRNVLGHLVSARGIEVDSAKVDVIAKLPPPENVKGI